MEGLTERQLEVLTFIIGYIIVHQYPPCIRDMRSRLKINSTNGVRDHLLALQKKGYIDWIPGKSRTIRILQEPQFYKLTGNLQEITGRRFSPSMYLGKRAWKAFWHEELIDHLFK